MHIILISSTIEPTSGYGTLTHNHCAALFKKGVLFTLLLPRGARRISSPYESHVRYILPDLPLSFSKKGFFKIPLLWTSLDIILPPHSIIHSLVDFPYALLGMRLAQKYHLPHILHAIGTYSVLPFYHFPDSYFMYRLYRSADTIISISQFTATAMKKAAGYSREIVVIHPPVA